MAFLCIQDLIYYYHSTSGILSNQFFHLECQMEIMYSSSTAATYHHHTTHDTIRCFCCCWCWLVGDGDLKYLNKCDIKYLSNKNTINKYWTCFKTIVVLFNYNHDTFRWCCCWLWVPVQSSQAQAFTASLLGRLSGWLCKIIYILILLYTSSSTFNDNIIIVRWPFVRSSDGLGRFAVSAWLNNDMSRR